MGFPSQAQRFAWTEKLDHAILLLKFVKCPYAKSLNRGHVAVAHQ